MSIPVLTFFNNKGGVGKTSLVYHLAWMFSLLDKRVVAVDLDPQANLTAAFLEEDAIDAIWNPGQSGATIWQCVKPLASVNDIAPPVLQKISENLSLLPGDVALSAYENALATEWPKSMGDADLYRPMRILSAFWQVMQMAGQQVGADIVLVDTAPNLGAINRSVFLATDYVAIPLGADLFSLQGLSNLGPTLQDWRKLWQKRLDNWRDNSEAQEHPEFKLPAGKMQPIGYLCQQYGLRLERPVRAYDQWVRRIPARYRETVLDEPAVADMMPDNDPYCLATLRPYRSLAPMARECRKPIFSLTSADGAIGNHANAVQDAKRDFRQLAGKIADRIGLEMTVGSSAAQ